MSFITIGDIVAVTVDSIAIADGKVTLLVSDRDGVEYTMQIGRDLPMAPSRPQAAQEGQPAPSPSTSLAQAPAGQPAAQQAPSSPPQGVPEAPAQGVRPREHDDPEMISLWLADHPEDLRGFAARLSHRKRKMIAGMLTELLGSSIAESDAIRSFSAVDPPPEFVGGGTMWGYEGSPLAAELHEGKINKLLAQESTGHGKVDDRLANLAVQAPKGNTLASGDAASQFKDWSSAAMGK